MYKFCVIVTLCMQQDSKARASRRAAVNFGPKVAFANSGVRGSAYDHLHLHQRLLSFHTAPSVPRSQVFNNLKDVSRDIFTVEGKFWPLPSQPPRAGRPKGGFDQAG